MDTGKKGTEKNKKHPQKKQATNPKKPSIPLPKIQMKKYQTLAVAEVKQPFPKSHLQDLIEEALPGPFLTKNDDFEKIISLIIGGKTYI